MIDEQCDAVKEYHECTKHHFHRYANSLGYMDWNTQPDPFRNFIGADCVRLPFVKKDETPPYNDVFIDGKVSPKPLNLKNISHFLECSLALSAWKQYGASKWALRVNPSSGNLHPTEGYLLLPPIAQLSASAAAYHYSPKNHGLEKRAEFSPDVWPLLPENTFLVGLTSIHWREAWKYGERAFRYCQHDCGHGYMALAIAARILGWRIQLIGNLSDQDTARILGLNREHEFVESERESPELLAVVFCNPQNLRLLGKIPEQFVKEVENGVWFGKVNRLSVDHHKWEVIGDVERACEKPETNFQGPVFQAKKNVVTCDKKYSALKVVKKRRSAVAMDGKTSMAREEFYQMMRRVSVPMEGIPWTPRIHLFLFVHRVEGLPPGLYLLVRDSKKLDVLKENTHKEFLWKKPKDCPEELPLYFLSEGDFRETAKTVSCVQDIAADGAFSLGMIAEFDSAFLEYGAWFYKRLFWETGMIGQLLYLEAEALDFSATGIGCFFDDAMHEIFGLKKTAFQSLYHFTVGGAVVDNRLTTLPAYEE